MTASLHAYATGRDWDFVSIGVSVDESPTEGIETLARVAVFDEIAVGAGWRNMAAQHYIWTYHIEHIVPQVVVAVRRFTRDETWRDELESEQILKRIIGTPAMEAWAAEGFNLPHDVIDHIALPPG